MKQFAHLVRFKREMTFRHENTGYMFRLYQREDSGKYFATVSFVDNDSLLLAISGDIAGNLNEVTSGDPETTVIDLLIAEIQQGLVS